MASYFNKIKDKIFNYQENEKLYSDENINYYEWHNYNNNNWFTKFVQYNFPNVEYKLNFYGVLGKGKAVKRVTDGGKIFFSGENLDKRFTKWNWIFGDYCIKDVDLAMGFADLKNEKYMRLPLWITYVFSPTSTATDISEKISRINNVRFNKKMDSVLLAGHDKHGTRKMIYDGLKNIFDIKCAGKWNNNTDELWTKYNNNKIEYIKNFKFNICPENINTPNYVTEKLFEAFLADCIPIYYGADNNPEPNIINDNAVLFWKKNNDNKENKKLILELLGNDKLYREFISQPKFKTNADDVIINIFDELKCKIEKIIKKGFD